MVNRSHHQYKADILKLGKLDDTMFVHIVIPQDATVVGKRVKEIDLPEDSLIVSVQRGKKQHVVHGNTVLQSGDKITVFTEEECFPSVRDRLTMITQESDEVDDSGQTESS
jgi:Trk K+ transport system NAD-binding subunit